MKKVEGTEGILYLCATPIGNLEDLTFRALRILKEADLIAAEDTRHTRKLLNHYQISTPLTSYHQHNARQKGQQLLELLEEGKQIALVSDAGTPGISDPGSLMVKLAIEAGFSVVPIPGATAAIASLIASGLPTEKFVFEGFLPRNSKERQGLLEKLQEEERTLIFYEAPHRLMTTLKEFEKFFPDREMAFARELTKHYEEFIRGMPGKLIQHFQTNTPRGEFTLVVEGKQKTEEKPLVLTRHQLVELVKELEEKGWNSKDAIKEAARQTGLPKREIYQAVKIEPQGRGSQPDH